MKTIPTRELTGENLLSAVALALRQSHAELSAKVDAMNLDQINDYLAKHPYLELDDVSPADVKQLREAILRNHEPLLPGEDDLAEASQEDLWPLCERLLERYDISLSPRIEVATKNKVWLADSDDFRVVGQSPREAVLRCYVTLKLGLVVKLED